MSAHAYELRHVVSSIFGRNFKKVRWVVSVLYLSEYVQTALLLLTLGSLYVPVGTFLPQKRADLCH